MSGGGREGVLPVSGGGGRECYRWGEEGRKGRKEREEKRKREERGKEEREDIGKRELTHILHVISLQIILQFCVMCVLSSGGGVSVKQ